MKSKVTENKAKKRILAMFLCAALMLNGGISVMADTGEGNPGENNSTGTTVTSGDASGGDVKIDGSLEINATIHDKSDSDDHTFELELEAWVTGTLVKEETPAQTSSVLDKTAVLKSQVSDYFDYDCTCEGNHNCIRVYTSVWDGSEFREAVQIYPATGEHAGEEGVTVTVEGKTVKVTGFSYKEHPVAQGDITEKGQKLIVKIPVETAVGFWGGNNVPVSESSTAIYNSNGQVEKAFPIPEANVPLSVQVAAQNKTIYYGGEVSGADLLSGVTAGYQTVGTAEGAVTVKDDGTFASAAEWRDDYAVITWTTYAGREWTEGMGSLPTDAVSKVSTGDYTFTVNASPLAEASANADHPGLNADGGAIAGRAVEKEGISASATGHVYILIPVITFKDANIYRGFIPDNDYFKNNNIQSVEWTEMDESSTYPAADPYAEPELIFAYTPEYLDYITDTKVRVAVAIRNNEDAEPIDVTNVARFRHKTRAFAEEESNQFNILVVYNAPFELPATGGAGTFGYTLAGMMLLAAAAILLYKKRQCRI